MEPGSSQSPSRGSRELPEVRLSSVSGERGWGAVFKAATEDRVGWEESELPVIWRHQLANILGNPPIKSLKSATFEELWFGLSPDLKLFRDLKEYGKANCSRNDSLIPEEIARALYYLSIFAAQLRLGVAISSLGSQELVQAAEWLANCGWLDAESRRLAVEFGRRGDAPAFQQEKPTSA